MEYRQPCRKFSFEVRKTRLTIGKKYENTFFFDSNFFPKKALPTHNAVCQTCQMIFAQSSNIFCSNSQKFQNLYFSPKHSSGHVDCTLDNCAKFWSKVGDIFA